MPWEDHYEWSKYVDTGGIGLTDSLASLYAQLASLGPDDFNAWLDFVDKTLVDLAATPILVSDLLDSLQAWYDSPALFQDQLSRPSPEDFAAWADIIEKFQMQLISVHLYDANLGWIIIDSGNQ